MNRVWRKRKPAQGRHKLGLHYIQERDKSTRLYLWGWVHRYTRLHSDSSGPHFSHLPTREAPVGSWSTPSDNHQTQQRHCHGDHESLARTVKLSINDRCRLTWKKLSSLSLSIPSLSKSDTLKIRLRAFTQRDFIWHRDDKGQGSHVPGNTAQADNNNVAEAVFILLQLSSLDNTEGP